jgi:hypothetical protein
MKKRFAIERRDLAKYSVEELGDMVHFLNTVWELVGEASISSDMEPLADLDEALRNELRGIERVLFRIERRLAVELATRKAGAENAATDPEVAEQKT